MLSRYFPSRFAPVWRRAGLAGALLLIMAAGTATALWWDARHQASAQLQALRAAQWHNPQGEMIQPFAPGPRFWVINIWAPWCAPCIEEMPALNQWAALHANQGVRVVGLGVDNTDNIRAFLARVPIAYSVVVSGVAGLAWSRQWGNVTGGIPYTVVMDDTGRVRWRFAGKLTLSQLSAAVADAHH